MKRFESGLLLCSDGQFGLGPPITVEGDMVCVLYGFRVPFVLRADSATEYASKTYTLIDSCLFSGFMNGEELEMGLLEDIILS